MNSTLFVYLSMRQIYTEVAYARSVAGRPMGSATKNTPVVSSHGRWAYPPPRRMTMRSEAEVKSAHCDESGRGRRLPGLGPSLTPVRLSRRRRAYGFRTTTGSTCTRKLPPTPTWCSHRSRNSAKSNWTASLVGAECGLRRHCPGARRSVRRRTLRTANRSRRRAC